MHARCTTGNGELIKADHSVPPMSSLAKSEQELADAVATQFEAFYQTGEILERIRSEKEYQDAGYTSFDKYMNGRMPCGIRKTAAWQLINATRIRPLLPDVDSANAESSGWTEGAIRPLTRGEFDSRRIRNIGKRIKTRIEKGDVLTAKLVKQELDHYTGADVEREQRKAEKIAATETAFQVMKRLRREMNMWKKSLETVSEEFWEDAEGDNPDCIQRATAAVRAFLSDLEQRSKRRRPASQEVQS